MGLSQNLKHGGSVKGNLKKKIYFKTGNITNAGVAEEFTSIEALLKVGMTLETPSFNL